MFDYLNYQNTIPLDKCLLGKVKTLNPLTAAYEVYWKAQKRKCIEGNWIEHEGRWRWMPGPLYFYVNFWHIEGKKATSTSKGKSKMKPMLRDVEWIKFYVNAVIRGFSGFAEEKYVSCHRILADPLTAEQNIADLPPIEAHKKPHFYTPEGKLKRYVPALEYLYETQLCDYGKPLYHNQSLNLVDLEARGGGKSYTSAALCAHNFLFDGAQDYDALLASFKDKERMSSQTLIGAIDTKYTAGVYEKYFYGIDNLEGGVSINGRDYPSPLSKKYTGSWTKTLIQEYEEKRGGQWHKGLGSKSKLHHRTFGDNPFAANGTRPTYAVLDEIGFHYNLPDCLGQLKECLQDGAQKDGSVHMCVCAGTMVWTADGRLVPIETIAAEDGIIGWDECSKSSAPTAITSMFAVADKECYRLTTNTGRFLECSHDHPILWSNKDFGSHPRSKDNPSGRKFIKKAVFKEMAAIKIGDQVAISEDVNVFGSQEMWEPRAVGMLIGDGTYGNDKTPVFSNCDAELNQYMDERFSTVVEKSYETKDGRLYRETRVRGICPELRKLGIYKQTKLLKRLPDIITACTKEAATELLAGLFDTDGHVWVGSNGVAQIGLTASSEVMLEQVRMLLQKLGIHGGIKARQPREGHHLDRNVYYVLTIADKRSLLAFHRNIKLLVKYKQENLERIAKMYEGSPFMQSASIQGLRFERVVAMESIGMKPVYNLTAAGHHTYMANGIVTHNCGTGGDMEGGSTEAVKTVFYDPENWDCLAFDDIFEDTGKKIGFFFPAYMTLNDFKDELGNTHRARAIAYLNTIREKLKKGKSKKPYEDELQQRPLVPSEVFLLSEGNIFPALELKAHLGILESSSDADVRGQCGELVETGSGVTWEPDLTGKLRANDYPILKADEDTTGSIVIWEHPVEGAPYGLHVAGCDPYSQDPNQGVRNSITSLGAVFIIRRAMPGFGGVDKVVAEYSAKPAAMKTFYENVRKLMAYYNGTLLYENQILGLKAHFENAKALHFLAYTPTILKANQRSTVSRVYGQHASEPVRDELELMTRDWLLEPCGEAQEDGSMRLNLHNLCSVPLVKELIAYNDHGNFDRVDAFMLAICQKRQLHHHVVEKKKEVKRDSFFSRIWNGGN